MTTSKRYSAFMKLAFILKFLIKNYWGTCCDSEPFHLNWLENIFWLNKETAMNPVFIIVFFLQTEANFQIFCITFYQRKHLWELTSTNRFLVIAPQSTSIKHNKTLTGLELLPMVCSIVKLVVVLNVQSWRLCVYSVWTVNIKKHEEDQLINHKAHKYRVFEI